MNAMPSVVSDIAIYFLFMVAATSVLSLPLAPATLLAAKTASPLAVALAAAAAAALASVFDYYFVRRVFRLQALAAIRDKSLFRKAERWAKVAPFLTTAAFAAIPIPFTIVRVLMPLSGYAVGKYAGAVALGRFPRIFVIASFGTLVDIPTPVLLALFAAGLVTGATTAAVRGRGYLFFRKSTGDTSAARASNDATRAAPTGPTYEHRELGA